MRSKLLSSLVAGSLVLASSVAVAQPYDNSTDQMAEENDNDSDATIGILFGLIVFAIAIWVGRDNGGDDDIGTPTSP